MGEVRKDALRFNFDTQLKLEFHGARITSDAGLLAYNLGNFLRRLALPTAVKHWTLTTMRDKLVKIGAKIVRHARYVTFQLAEVAVPRNLLRQILNRIRRLGVPPPLAVTG